MKYAVAYEIAHAMKYAAAYGGIYFISYFTVGKIFHNPEDYFILRSNISFHPHINTYTQNCSLIGILPELAKASAFFNEINP